MKVRTTGQLFPHKCQIKDMKLSGFSPSSIRYHCVVCGGILVLRLEREQWESVFGSKKSLTLSKTILQSLDALTDDEEIQTASAEMGDPEKFVWTPPDDDDEE
ncbi:MAG: hypothetical protein AB7S38_38130 [Vulcanimicrobiota bacterium]